MAEYQFEKDSVESFALGIKKQNLTVNAKVTDAEKTGSTSGATQTIRLMDNGDRQELVLSKLKAEPKSYNTSYVLTIESGGSYTEIGIPEDFAMKIIRKITEEGMI